MSYSAEPATYLNVRDLFDDRFFIIPDYQRGYSWGEENVKDLLQDAFRAHNKSTPHYTGTVVARHCTENQTWEIIDGQQRLTTLVLIMFELSKRLPDRLAAIRAHYIRRGALGNERLVLTPNEEIRDYFIHRVLDGDENAVPAVGGHRAINTALNTIQAWLEKEKAGIQPLELLETIETRMNLLLFVPPSSQEAGAMFEVINNRGVELSQLQMVKNYLLYFAAVHELESLRSRINSTWQVLLHNLDRAGIGSGEAEDQFLRNCYLVFFETNKSRSWSAYSQIKEWYPVDTDEVESITGELTNFIKFLEVASLNTACLRNSGAAKEKFGKNLQVLTQLKNLRCHSALASFMPMLLSVMSRVSDLEDLHQILSLIERANFRVYLLPRVSNRSDSGQGDLFYKAFQFYHEALDLPTLSNEIVALVQTVSPVRTVAEHLTIDKGETEDYYWWQAIKYFLARYEEFLRKDNNDTFDIEQILETREEAPTGRYLSLEHIWAQKNLEETYKPDYSTKRRLGNFVLLELNKNIWESNKDIEMKVDELITNAESAVKLEQIFELEGILDEARKNPEYTKFKNKVAGKYATLAAALADIRETRLIRFALRTWALPGDDLTEFLQVDTLSDQKRSDACWFRV